MKFIKHYCELLSYKNRSRTHLRQANREIACKLEKIAKSSLETPLELRNCINAIYLQEIKHTQTKRFRKKERFKSVFFYLTIFLMVAVVIGASYIIWLLVKNPSPNGTGTVITAIAALVATLLGLPTIIANYLFDKEEDGSIGNQMTGMRDSDTKERMEEKKAKKAKEEQQKITSNITL